MIEFEPATVAPSKFGRDVTTSDATTSDVTTSDVTTSDVTTSDFTTSEVRSCYRSYRRRFKSGMRLFLSKKVEDRNKQEKE